MTDFVVAAVQTAARDAIEQADVIRLSLLSPPPRTDALKRAFDHEDKLLRSE